jgi:hypothetical protein
MRVFGARLPAPHELLALWSKLTRSHWLRALVESSDPSVILLMANAPPYWELARVDRDRTIRHFVFSCFRVLSVRCNWPK